MAAQEGDLGVRLERIGRRLALYDLIATYGPAVDSGSADAAAGIWDADGGYDYGEHTLHGQEEIRAMVERPLSVPRTSSNSCELDFDA